MIDRRTIALCALALAGGGGAKPGPDPFQGTWGGVLKTEEPMRVELLIQPGPRAVLISLDEGAQVEFANDIRIAGDTIRVDFQRLSGRFEGRLVGSDRIDGVWRQMIVRLPLILRRQAGPSVPFAARQDRRRRP